MDNKISIFRKLDNDNRELYFDYPPLSFQITSLIECWNDICFIHQNLLKENLDDIMNVDIEPVDENDTLEKLEFSNITRKSFGNKPNLKINWKLSNSETSRISDNERNLGFPLSVKFTYEYIKFKSTVIKDCNLAYKEKRNNKKIFIIQSDLVSFYHNLTISDLIQFFQNNDPKYKNLISSLEVLKKEHNFQSLPLGWILSEHIANIIINNIRFILDIFFSKLINENFKIISMLNYVDDFIFILEGNTDINVEETTTKLILSINEYLSNNLNLNINFHSFVPGDKTCKTKTFDLNQISPMKFYRNFLDFSESLNNDLSISYDMSELLFMEDEDIIINKKTEYAIFLESIIRRLYNTDIDSKEKIFELLDDVLFYARKNNYRYPFKIFTIISLIFDNVNFSDNFLNSSNTQEVSNNILNEIEFKYIRTTFISILNEEASIIEKLKYFKFISDLFIKHEVSFDIMMIYIDSLRNYKPHPSEESIKRIILLDNIIIWHLNNNNPGIDIMLLEWYYSDSLYSELPSSIEWNSISLSYESIIQELFFLDFPNYLKSKIFSLPYRFCNSIIFLLLNRNQHQFRTQSIYTFFQEKLISRDLDSKEISLEFIVQGLSYFSKDTDLFSLAFANVMESTSSALSKEYFTNIPKLRHLFSKILPLSEQDRIIELINILADDIRFKEFKTLFAFNSRLRTLYTIIFVFTLSREEEFLLHLLNSIKTLQGQQWNPWLNSYSFNAKIGDKLIRILLLAYNFKMKEYTNILNFTEKRKKIIKHLTHFAKEYYKKTNERNKANEIHKTVVNLDSLDKLRGILKKENTECKITIAPIAFDLENDLNPKMQFNSTNIKKRIMYKVRKAVNEAIKQKSSILILPEMTVPMNELNKIVTRLSQSNIILICGLEYFHTSTTAQNITVISFPANRLRNPMGKNYLLYHQIKNFPTAEELFFINKLIPAVKYNSLNTIFLFISKKWQNFSVLTCSDFLSLSLRWMLQKDIQTIFVPAQNKDSSTYDALAEASIRDLHCLMIVCCNQFLAESFVKRPNYKNYERTLFLHSGNSTPEFHTLKINPKLISNVQKSASGFVSNREYLLKGSLMTEKLSPFKDYKQLPPDWDYI